MLTCVNLCDSINFVYKDLTKWRFCSQKKVTWCAHRVIVNLDEIYKYKKKKLAVGGKSAKKKKLV